MTDPVRRKPHVLVLMGGPDAERKVSIMSGQQIAEGLRRSGRFQVVERIIDCPDAAELAMLAAEAECDAVFPALHGRWGEGGPLQESLEGLGLAYVGSGPRAAALAMDKILTKRLLDREGPLQTPESIEFTSFESCSLPPPLVLKPVDDGSSVDLRICMNEEEVAAALKELHEKRSRLMAEQYIRGREMTVGILHGKALPLIEIIPAVEFYDYEAKYTREDTTYVVEPALPGETATEMKRTALRAFETLGCRDVGRVDFIVDERGAWFLEINTMPGFTTHSLVPMAALATGINMPELCARLVDAALQRDSRRQSTTNMLTSHS